MIGDAQAIQQCLAGHLDAYRHIVERHQVRAFGHALALTGDREDARDAVQEAFLDAFRALNGFDPNREFYPWFYVLLRNRCFKSVRGRQRRRAALQRLAEHLQLVRRAESGDDSAQRINEVLWSLQADDREIIMLRHFDGLSYAELAERLQIPNGTVMSRLHHARRRFQQTWQGTDKAKSNEADGS